MSTPREGKEYSLKKTDNSEYPYIDQDGVSHRSPKDWLWGFLGGCGCGSSDEFAEEAMKVLELFATPNKDRKWHVYDDRFHELLAHWFDSIGFLEHGSSVGGSWLSEKGERIYGIIDEFAPPIN